LGSDFSPQQPGGVTPGVAAAPVALAGAIVPGIAKFIVVLSAHADVFGVGITVIVGSMLVPPSCVITCGIVPGDGFAGISGVEIGRAAPLVGGPPGIELHTVVEGLPSGDAVEMFPVVVITLGVGIVPNGAPGIIMDVETGLCTIDDVGTGGAIMGADGREGIAGGCGAGTVEPGKSDMNDVAGCADSAGIAMTVLPVAETGEMVGTVGAASAADIDDVAPIAPTTDDREVTGTAGVPGKICPIGVEQVTTVPGIVGSEASGTGANVVSGAPD
jgi:hypothetical protein